MLFHAERRAVLSCTSAQLQFDLLSVLTLNENSAHSETERAERGGKLYPRELAGDANVS